MIFDPDKIVRGPKPYGGVRRTIQSEDGRVAEFWTWPDGRIYVARILRVCQSDDEKGSE